MKKTLLLSAFVAASISAFGQTAVSDTVPAQFPGGKEAMTEYINKNIKYPQASINNCIEGAVDVKFNVKKDGALDRFVIVRPVDPDLEGEAVRLVKGMPAWTPASVGGRPVESDAVVQILFTLPD